MTLLWRWVTTHDCHETLTQCWFNVGPSSATLAQQWTNIGSVYRVRWDGITARLTNTMTSPIDKFRTMIDFAASRSFICSIIVLIYFITLLLKGGICHFTKWQIPPFNIRVTVIVMIIDVLIYFLSWSHCYSVSFFWVRILGLWGQNIPEWLR